MNETLKKFSPYLILLLGLYLLFFLGLAEPAGVLFLISYVIIVESIWPEKWGSDE